jgi:peptidyl-dipeptidase Dcp
MKSMKRTKELTDLSSRMEAQASRFISQVSNDPKLFARIKAVEAKGALRLTEEEAALLERIKSYFTDVPAEKLSRMQEIQTQLTELQDQFQKNVAAETNSFALELDKKDVEGIPELVLAAAKEEAIKRKKPDKWIFTMARPSYIPFMQFVKDRDLRHKMWLAFNSRCVKPPYDNHLLIGKIIALRQELAEIRGFKNFAEMVLKDRMAQNSANVDLFLRRLFEVYRPHAVQEINELEDFAGHKIEAWDVSYYTRLLKLQKLNFDPEEYRPYFSYDNVLKGAISSAEKHYGIRFIARPEVQTWNKAVRAFEVLNRLGEHLGFYYLDPFPRKGKRVGNWMENLVAGGQYRGEKQRPHVVNGGNLTAPIGSEPALLSIEDVRTVFHEMGHSLHNFLSHVSYTDLFGTNVALDFVELPSQLFEYWAFEPEVMKTYAVHYKTREVISDEMIERLRAAEKIGRAYDGLVRVFKGRLDMEWHAKNHAGKSVEEVENKVREEVLPIAEPGAVWSTGFYHVFASEYAAGMYSYDWDKNLAADAMVPFKKYGLFDPTLAFLYQTHIMEAGRTASPNRLYLRFRGQAPDPDALLKEQGFLPER